MKESDFVFQKGLIGGLRKSAHNLRNSEALILATGMLPEDGALRSVDILSDLTGLAALGESFPFPQVHVGQVHTVIMGAETIWEYVGSTPVEVLSGLTAGALWSVADFGDYIVMTNGQQMVRRSAVTHTWEVFEDDDIPLSNCVAAVNGQLIVGSPQKEF